ncbi:MAG: hypothetical protein RLZ12_1012 [Bacillota bacterium]|jgi:YidC/Oxa1 family membrane protein insertase
MYYFWGLSLFIIILTGCSYDTTSSTEPGLWQQIAVKPLSDLLDYLGGIFDSYGMALLIVTLLMRMVIFPFTLKQQQSVRDMKRIQPQINKLQEKYKKDTNKLNEEKMRLYREQGINPLGGCLPLLIQMPLMIALWQAISSNATLGQAHFLFFLLGKPDQTYILPILAAVTTYLQTKLAPVDASGQPGWMMWFTPVLSFVFAVRLPAALPLYWIFGNIISILQVWVLQLFKKETALRAKE